MVELKEGCNHMTCRCTAEFCMICGSKWKTCDCPWFNYEVGDGDRLNHVNVPLVRVVRGNGNGDWRNQVRYHDEIERRREQERRDEALARRLQLLGPDNGDDDLHSGNDRRIVNFGDPFLNMRFINEARAEVVHNGSGRGTITPPPPPGRPGWLDSRSGSPDPVGPAHLPS